jgi:hypothetical protein
MWLKGRSGEPIQLRDVKEEIPLSGKERHDEFEVMRGIIGYI